MSELTRDQAMALVTRDAPPARLQLEASVLQLAVTAIHKAIVSMPTRRLHEVVAAPAVVGAARLVEAATLAEATHDPLAPARARVASVRAQLLKTAGGTLEREGVMARTGVSHQTVSNWRRAGTIIALPRGMRDFVFPACQFTDTGLLPGLAAVLRASPLRDPWSRLGMLMTASERLEGRSPFEALREGDVEGAVSVAREAGGAGDEDAPSARAKRGRRQVKATAR